MKLLLVQVPTSHLGAGEKVYPMGLSRLSSLVPAGVEKQGLDMNLSPDPWLHLQQTLTGFNPDVVALSFRNLDPLAGQGASYLSSLKTAASLVHTLVPGARILAGGPAFSLFARQLMEMVPEIDAGIVGEGEPIFAGLLEPDKDFRTLPGVIWRDRQQIRITRAGEGQAPCPKFNLDHLPPLDTRTFDPGDYTKENAYVAAMGIEGKRGCDLWCGYCLYPFLGGTRMRLRDPVKIVDEMEILHQDHGISLFHFTDSVVNRPTDHFEQVCRELVRRKLDLSWTGFFREESLTRDNLGLARKAGLCAVYFSGDALTAHGLKLLNKQMTVEDILRAARITAQSGILTMCHFLVNLPGEDETGIDEARNLLEKILEIHHPAGNLGAVIFNHIRLYPGAPLTRRLIREGLLDPELDLVYPVFHNPAPLNHVLHEFEALCHRAGVFSRLTLDFA